MGYIRLSQNGSAGIKIFIFTEGTILKPKSFFSLYSHKSYLPIGNCAEIIKAWSEQGAEIVYCTSCKGRQAEEIAGILKRYNFLGTMLFFRDKGQQYKDIAELVKPNILIEDDCKSIGGSWQMCITNVEPELKKSIHSIVVKEFKGIDDLPMDICKLQALNRR